MATWFHMGTTRTVRPRNLSGPRGGRRGGGGVAWRAARSADPGIGRRGVSEMSRHKISKKFLDTMKRDSEVNH